MIQPINAVRVLLFFRYKNFTWSETYWQAGSSSPDPTVDDQAAISEATLNNGLCETRVGLLGAGVELIEVRASRDDVFRDSLLTTKYAQWQAPKGARPDHEIYNAAYCDLAATPPVCEQAAEPEVVLRVRCEAASTRRRVMFLGGVPQFADIPGANIPLPAALDPTGEIDTASFNAAFSKWAQAVIAGNWGYVSVQYTAVQPIVGMTTNVGGTQVVVTTKAPLGVNPNDTCLIFRPKFNPGSYNFHGQREVTAVAGNTVTFAANLGNAAFSYLNGGLLKGPAVRVFSKFTAIIGDVVGERKRGNAELAIRGRSRTRRSYVG